MPAIENVTRRGAVYWWRRRLRFFGGESDSIMVATSVSLLTKDQATARRRAAALTGRSEVIRVGLYQKIEQEGLTAEQAIRVFQDEVVRYRNMLVHQHEVILADGEGDERRRLKQMLTIYEAVNADFVVNGFADYGGIDYVGSLDWRFQDLDEETRAHIKAILFHAGDLPGNLLNEAADTLRRVGIPATPERLALARRIICDARASAARTYAALEEGVLSDTAAATALIQAAVAAARPMLPPVMPPLATMHPNPSPPASATAPAPVGPVAVPDQAITLTEEQQRFANMTPLEVAEAFMRAKPKTGGPVGRSRPAPGHALKIEDERKPRSQARTWGDSQRRQFRAAPWLFGKSNGAQPLARTSTEDLCNFYDLLNRLPSSHHKSPRHEPMTLLEICEEAEQQIEDQTAGSFRLGLDVGTINRHFTNLKNLCEWLAKKTPMAALDFSDFILEEEDSDERLERDAYTIDQGRELFQLPIWTGCTSIQDRLSPGRLVWHDSAFWVMPIVWYSGMRREEACKLLIDDIGEEDGIWFFNIRRTHAGGVKTATSVRKVPISPQLIRIGFLSFVEAMRDACETYLFPEILPGKGGRAIGDVFYSQVWLKIKPHLKLVKPGQAVHSGRHMVSTELKMLQTFEEFRSDLLGQKTSGENGGRYADAARLQVLLDVVERIPNVTDDLPTNPTINLLPAELRVPRPVRDSQGRRQRV